MRHLLAFLLKHYFILLFILLEVFAFSLIINNNYYHNSVILNSTNHFTGSILNTYNNISEYFSLKHVNKELAEENARLHSLSEISFLKTDTSFLYKDTLYKFISAKVINNSTNKRNNYMMLNKGTKHGIKADMGVICSNGIVGIVTSASVNFCSVMSVLHENAKISAKIKKNNQLVNVVWNNIDYKIGTIEDIPTQIYIHYGDTIITSGHSFIFPEGILIGTVKNYLTEKGESMNRALIDFSTDFNNLHYVYIIDNIMKDEQLNLEEVIEYE